MGGWGGRSAGRLALPALIACVLMVSLSFSGCLGTGNGEQVTASLTIDFMGQVGTIHPGNVTVWEQVNGAWTTDTQYNDGRTVWIFKNLTCQPTVLGLLEEASSVGDFELETTRYTGMGTLVTAIGGVENEAGGSGWQYEVNGEYANLAADAKELSDGDQVVWKFSPAPW